MIKQLYNYRFHIFIITQVLILFGSLLFSVKLFDDIISPILFVANQIAGLVVLLKNKKLFWLGLIMLVLGAISLSLDHEKALGLLYSNSIKLFTYFTFYFLVTEETIKQVWKTKRITDKTILGLISGFLSIGLIGFFMFFATELFFPNSFSLPQNGESIVQNLMYFSYITLLTIGYGDILPLTSLAQKTVMLVGIAGQIYLVVISGVIIGKYINQKKD